ncbi:MAG: hypothetical protein ACOX4D_03545 [Bacteroidales bacterium]
MKKTRFIVLLSTLALIFGLSSCKEQKKQNEHLLLVNDSLRTVIQGKDEVINNQEQELNDFVGLIVEIQETIDAINNKRKELTTETIEQSGKATEQSKDQLRKDMKDLYSMVNNSRQQIANLKSKLNSSNTNIANLESIVANLENDLNASNQEIIELRNLVEKQTGQITDLEQTITEQVSQIEDLETTLTHQTNTLNTAWYIVAPRKALLNEGIIDRKGRVLLDSSSSFIQIDIRETRVIPINSKKITILSAHPESAYQIETDEETGIIDNITITDPESFWSLEKRLVILIK